MMTKENMDKAAEKVPFETVLARLEGIVRELEKGNMSLENSVKSYEKGVGLVKNAQTKIAKMEKRIEELTSSGKVKPLKIAPEG